MTTKAISRGWQGKQVSSFGNFRRNRKPNNAYINTNGLTLYYDFGNGNSFTNVNTTVTDLSGNGNNGTLTNGPVYSGLNNGVVTLDGVNDYIATTYAPALNDFTVLAWFRCTNNVSFSRVVEKNFINGMWIGRNSSTANSWGGGVREAGAPYGRFITLKDGEWHMIVSVRNGTTHTIYGDGITNLATGTVSSTALSTQAFLFGINVSLTVDQFGGEIGQVAIYNRALEPAEIQQNFNAMRVRYGV